MRVAHISDLHFGRLSYPDIQEDLIDSIRTAECDAVLITGDLTQRARRSEFRAARAFLDALQLPQLVIPGNHDMHAWWHRPDLRIFNPFRRYQKKISKELEPELSLDGLAVLGLNTSHGLSIKGGRCIPEQIGQIHEYFLPQPPDTFKVLAVHHPLLPLQPFKEFDVAHRGEQLVHAAMECGIDVICAGHWHLTYIESYDTFFRRILISVAGTATSDRGRFPHGGANAWVLIEKNSLGLDTQFYRYDRDTRIFNLMNHTRYLPDGQNEEIT